MYQQILDYVEGVHKIKKNPLRNRECEQTYIFQDPYEIGMNCGIKVNHNGV